MIDIASTITSIEAIAGEIKIALSDAVIIGKAIPQIHADIKAGKSLPEVAAALEPDALAVLESIANFVFPGAGTALGVLAYVVKNSQPLVPGSVEEKNYFDKATGQGF